MSLVFGLCLRLHFKQEWHPYVAKGIAHHKTCTLSPIVMNLVIILEVSNNLEEPTVHQFFLPEVII